MLETISSYTEQHHLLPEEGTVIVAVSGGADSLCLLHFLHRLCGSGKRYPAVSLYVAHLDHQLRGEASAQDAAAVAALAQNWHLPVTIGHADVPALARQERRSIEEMARIARYRFLRDLAQQVNATTIAIAHHRDDQVETLLLHWLRGGGLTSMIGLQPRQQDIIRPLLCVSRVDTHAYCAQHQLVPLDDASNNDTRFLRNRIRHELLPLLTEMNPGYANTLLRNAEAMRVDLAWIETQVDTHWSQIVSHVGEGRIQFHLSPLQALPSSLQRHLLRRASAHLCSGQSPLEVRHYQLIEQLLQRERTNAPLVLHLPQRLHLTRLTDSLLLEHVHADGDRKGPYRSNKREVTMGRAGSAQGTTPTRSVSSVGVVPNACGARHTGYSADPAGEQIPTGQIRYLRGIDGEGCDGTRPSSTQRQEEDAEAFGGRYLGEEDSRRGKALSPPVSSRQKPWAGTEPCPYESQIPTLEGDAEALLPVPGCVIVPDTSWLARADLLTDDLSEQVYPALHSAEWTTVWRLLPTNQHQVYIDADRLKDDTVHGSQMQLRVRTRRNGDRIQPLGMTQEKKIQDILVDKHIPRAQRSQIPLFFSATHCIWLAGIQVDNRVRLTPETRHILRLSIIPQSS